MNLEIKINICQNYSPLPEFFNGISISRGTHKKQRKTDSSADHIPHTDTPDKSLPQTSACFWIFLFTEPVFQVRSVDPCCKSSLSQYPEPGNIIFMAVIMLHWKRKCIFSVQQYGRTVDAVMLQKLLYVIRSFTGIYLPVVRPSGVISSLPVEQIAQPVCSITSV